MTQKHPNAVPLTPTLLRLADLIVAVRKESIAEGSLSRALGHTAYANNWANACQTAFESLLAQDALRACGLPSTDAVMTRLARSDLWPQEIREMDIDMLPVMFFFDPDYEGDGVYWSGGLDLSQAPKAILMGQMSYQITHIARMMAADEMGVDFKDVDWSSSKLGALPDQAYESDGPEALFGSIHRLMASSSPFVQGIAALPAAEKSEVIAALQEVYEKHLLEARAQRDTQQLRQRQSGY